MRAEDQKLHNLEWPNGLLTHS